MRASELLEAEGVRLTQWTRGDHRLPCPHCGKGKRDTALKVTVEPDGHAVWVCHRCRWAGTTKRRVRQEPDGRWEHRPRRNGPQEAPRTPVEADPLPADEGTPAGEIAFGDAHRRFWDKLPPITADDPVGRYLIGRRCGLPPAGADLRHAPDFRHPYCRWAGPAMVGLITHAVTREPMSFHLTWIAPDGTGKAPIERPRLLAKGMPKKEGVIRLCDDAEVTTALCIGEGIETALSFGQWLGQTALWAVIDSGNMAALPPLPGIEWLHIAVDHDRPNPHTGKRAGQEAANELARRWLRQAPHIQRVKRYVPPEEGQDANDLVQSLSRIAS